MPTVGDCMRSISAFNLKACDMRLSEDKKEQFSLKSSELLAQIERDNHLKSGDVGNLDAILSPEAERIFNDLLGLESVLLNRRGQ